LQCSENKNLQVKNKEQKRIIRFLKNCLLGVKRKLALLLILKIPTIKKAVELLNSIGVLKLTAINFKKTNIMKKMVFGLIATVMLSVSGNANEILNLQDVSIETQVSEQPKNIIKITIEFGRASRGCEGWGVCKMDIDIDFGSAFKATTDNNGNLILETNNVGIDQIKKHFGSSTTIVIEEDFKLSDEICKSLDINAGYIIKSGKYSIKNTSKGVFNITL
jgi:hypothetical protein